MVLATYVFVLVDIAIKIIVRVLIGRKANKWTKDLFKLNHLLPLKLGGCVQVLECVSIRERFNRVCALYSGNKCSPMIEFMVSAVYIAINYSCSALVVLLTSCRSCLSCHFVVVTPSHIYPSMNYVIHVGVSKYESYLGQYVENNITKIMFVCFYIISIVFEVIICEYNNICNFVVSFWLCFMYCSYKNNN